MKKNVFLVIFCLLLCAQAFGQTWNIGYPIETNVTATLDSGNGTLTISGTGEMKNFLSGSAIWYSRRSSIKTVKISENITNIGNSAFYDCSNLDSISIPESLTNIGENAFDFCSNLTSISIPKSVINIGNGAFRNSGLTSIVIPEGVTNIGEWVFNNCKNLVSIVIPSSVENIGTNYDFLYNCVSLVSIDVESGNEIYSSENGVLFNKDKTTLIKYPQGKTGIYTIPNGVENIGNQSFISCKNLTSINIASSVISIGYKAFQGSGLVSITIPEGVTSIGSIAFNACVDLAEIDLPESITSIGTDAFSGCRNLTSINIPSGMTSIESGVFFNCSNLKTVTIPNNIKSIGARVFSNCQNLKSITLSDSITSIAESAFNSCSSLAFIDIPNSVISIESSAFSHCTNLNAISMSDNVENIGNSAFYGCGITEISIPEKTTSIGHSAFAYCNSLVDISFNDILSYVGDYAFLGTEWYNNQLDGILYIGETLYANIGIIPENTSVNIKSGTVRIAAEAFYNCSGLVAVTIPESVAEIGLAAFVNCPNLASVANFSPVPQDIIMSATGGAFDVMSKDMTLYVPASSIFAYQNPSYDSYEWQYFNIVALPDLSEENIDITPSIDGATIEWQSYKHTEGYKLIIYEDEARTDTLFVFEFDAAGNLSDMISFRSTSTNISHTVENLQNNTDYFYTLEVLGVSGVVLASQSGEFTTSETTSIDVPLTNAETDIVGYYSILGEKLPEEPEKGLYIILYRDGKAGKIIKK